MVQKRDNMEFEVILALLRKENHLRGVAKEIGESHSTIYRKMGKLIKENVVGYKIEGKNKVFFIKKNIQAKSYVLNSERHKLIVLLRKYPELGVIIEDILKKTDERLIMLFGSYARFEANKGSDIDIYIETQSKKTKELVESINSKISVKIGKFDTNSFLVKEIIKNHIILRGGEEFYERIKYFE